MALTKQELINLKQLIQDELNRYEELEQEAEEDLDSIKDELAELNEVP